MIYVLSGVSMLATLIVILLLASIIGSLIWRRSRPAERTRLHHAVKAGLVAGVLATLAYDASRFLLIRWTGIQFWPFDIFLIFGQSLVGTGYNGWWVEILGVGFHLANGVGFAMAYTIAFGHKGIRGGIVWALILETMMVSVYPGWLGLKALDEFLSVSIFGHIIYGIVLGDVSKRLLRRWEGELS
ncbi:hypothetical protein [Desmospora profundinema]|uniref:Uncharacterized protein n=1 Tax=Desmospora profundinema TaxID=1571184 RepID=A0ABU1IPY1_9BACL|nr:hypothetical protein [Desmospora profundinema]MDR6226828.1 hypothetical protein [Desmospora profundinema]